MDVSRILVLLWDDIFCWLYFVCRRSLAVSKSNECEALIVRRQVCLLLISGVNCCDIAVITPYRAQVQLIKNLLYNLREMEEECQLLIDCASKTKITSSSSTTAIDSTTTSDAAIVTGDLKLSTKLLLAVEVGTVDGFQGREKEAIIISFVRSNDNNEIGFLSESRRTNVAISRARRHCCLIFDSSTLSSAKDEYLQKLIDYCYNCADLRDANDYICDTSACPSTFFTFNIEEFPVVISPPLIAVAEKDDSKKKKRTLPRKKKKSSEVFVKAVDDTTTEESRPLKASKKRKCSKPVAVVVEEAEKLSSEIEAKKMEPSCLDKTKEASLSEEVTQVKLGDDVDETSVLTSTTSSMRSFEPPMPTRKMKRKAFKSKQPIRLKKKKPKKPPPKKKGRKSSKTSSSLTATDDVYAKFDFSKPDFAPKKDKTICAFPSCSKKVHLIKQQCRFCQRIFCLKHGNPLFHSKKCELKLKRTFQIQKETKLSEIKKTRDAQACGFASVEDMHIHKEGLKEKLREKLAKAEVKRKKKVFRKSGSGGSGGSRGRGRGRGKRRK